jgi:hypothetical protein
MGELLVGSYWKNRKLSVREYADKTKRFIQSNSVAISFPPSGHPEFLHPEFYRKDFIAEMLKLTVTFWKPDSALFTSHSFRKKVGFKSGTDGKKKSWGVGLRIYLANPEIINSLPLDAIFQRLDAGGILIESSPEMLDPENPQQVAKTIAIRDCLYEKGLLAKR